MKLEKPLLINAGKGYTIKYKGRLLYSSFHPILSVLNRIKTLNIKQKTLLYIPSIGLGYGLKELASKLPYNSHILCIEIDQVLMELALKTAKDNFPIDKRITIMRTDSLVESIKKLKEIGIWKFRRVDMHILSGGYHLYSEKYKEIYKSLENEIQFYWKNKITLIHMAPLFIKNIFYNLIIFSFSKCINKLNIDLPVLVVGAGPSLEDSLNTIKRIRDKVVIIAVDTAVSVLLNKSIKPDFIFILESQYANLMDFISYMDPDIPIICDISSNPLIIRMFKKDIYFFASHFHTVSLFDRLKKEFIHSNVFPPLGSVGVAAVFAALKMTELPVILAGLDFSYTNNLTHCRGAPFHILMQLHSDRLEPVEHKNFTSIRKRPLVYAESKNRKPILSDLVLCSYARQLKNIAAGICRIYDIGRQGLDLGIKVIKEESVLDSILKETTTVYQENNDCESKTVINIIERINKFIEKESEHLIQAENVIRSILKEIGKGKERFTEYEEKIFSDIDYVYAHFPDHQPIPLCNNNFMIRSLISIKHYKEVIEKAQKVLISISHG